MATVHWGAAQWPYDQNDETNIAFNNKKRECYAKYAALADHHIEPVWVPATRRSRPVLNRCRHKCGRIARLCGAVVPVRPSQSPEYASLFTGTSVERVSATY